MLGSFDYDEAVREANRRRGRSSGRNVVAEEEEEEETRRRRPTVYLVQSLSGLRVLAAGTSSTPNATSSLAGLCHSVDDVRALLERKYQMDEPGMEQVGDFRLWTSIVDRELFAIREFPRMFWKARNRKFVFRKHYWGVAGYEHSDSGTPSAPPEKSGPGLFPTLFKEMSALRTVGNHDSVVRLLDIFAVGSRPNDLAVILVFDNWGYSLQEGLATLHAKRRMDSNPAIRRLIFQQVLTGLGYIHSRRIIHRNVTSTSVKLDAAGRVRIGGFNYAIPAGITVRAAPFPEEDFPVVYPDNYDHLAPEILLGSKLYDTSSDIWSAGMLFVELHLHRALYTPGTYPHPDPDQPAVVILDRHPFSAGPVMCNMFRVFGTPTDVADCWQLPYYHALSPKWPRSLDQLLADLPDSSRDLACQMLQYVPSVRPSAEQITNALC